METKDIIGIVIFVVAMLLMVYNIAITDTKSDSKTVEIISSSMLIFSSLYSIWLSLKRSKEQKQSYKK